VLLAGMMAPVALGAGALSNQVSDSVNSISASLAATQVPLVTTVTDKNGAPIAYLYDQFRLPASSAQIDPAMKAALVSVEDRRFYQDSGVDLRATLRAAMSNSSGGNTQGASTITQQYVKNYLINIVDRNNKAAQDADQAQTVARKLREAKIAMQLEQTMTKDQILTGYLNVVAFGAQVFGVGAAAQAYFGTTPDKLSVPQAALLAGMVNNPLVYDPYQHPAAALIRRNDVIDKMVQNGLLSAKDGKTAKATPLGVVPNGPNMPSGNCYGAADDAGFFCDYALEYLKQAGFSVDQLSTGGYTIRTTMDPVVSRIAKNAANNRVPTTQDGVANTFAIIQPGSTAHNVVALVENRNFGTGANAGDVSTNNVADVKDPFGAGSTYKLFTTAAAFENGVIGLRDSMPNPLSGCFMPTGLDPRYNHCTSVSNDNQGNPDPIPLTEALAISPNTAFVGLEVKTGMPAVLQMAYRLGMRDSMLANIYGGNPNSPANQALGGDRAASQFGHFRYGLSFTLGTAALAPMELANVGATIASGGVWCQPNPIISITDRYGQPVPFQRQPCEQAVPPGLANTLMNGMGQDTTVGTSAGAAKAAGWNRPTAGKTGTTQQNESVAFLGMVDNYAASSIVYTDGSYPYPICNSTPPHLSSAGPCAGGFGGTVAAPTFFDTFNQVLAGKPDIPLPGTDPAYLNTVNHGPTVPFVMWQPGDAAKAAVQQAGYQVVTKELSSTQPTGSVVGVTPQGNLPAGSVVTLYLSTGTLPPPQDPQPPASATQRAGLGGG
jgi:membrane peptidoglycan carboxypeptidase